MAFFLARRGGYPYQAPYTNATTVIAEPAITLPAKGGVYTDPQFGVDILRVTDATDGTGVYGTYYSYAPTLNADNTLVLVPDDGGTTGSAYFLQFNPSGSVPALVSTTHITIPGSSAVRYDLGRWARNTAAHLYATQASSLKLFRADFTTPTSPTQSVVADLTSAITAAIPSASFLWQFSLSDDDDVFAATVRDGSNVVAGWVVGKISTGTLLRYQATTDIDEVQISRDGLYLLWKASSSANDNYSVNVATGDTVFRQGPTNPGVGHSDTFGTDWVVGAQSNWTGKIVKFRLSAPNAVVDLSTANFTNNLNHFGMGADNQNWVLGEISHEALPRLAMDQEVVQLSIDGTQSYRRLFHHRSVAGDGYFYTPRANISRNGRFVAFSSNMGVPSGRVDLYIAKIPVAP